MGIPDEILAWSQSIPRWQRDALRRIVQFGKLSDSDVDDLVLIAKHASDYPGSSLLDSYKEISEHDLTGMSASGTVALLAIRETKAANAISDGAGLSFAPKGVTVVFGLNGSGKTSFARLLKKACRARGSGAAILPNLFDAASIPPVEATIDCDVAGVVRPLRFVDGQRPPAELANVAVFDTEFAAVSLSRETEAMFIPSGLDLFDKLARACDVLRQRLTQEVNNDPRRLFVAQEHDGTKTAEWLANLQPGTTDNELDQACAFGADNITELAQVERLLDVSDPARSAAEIQVRVNSYAPLT